MKKFITSEVHNFKMVNSRTIMIQVQEFQLTLHDIHGEGMVLNESFLVAIIIDKLPPFWKNFKNYLKLKQNKIGIEDLILGLRLEDDNKLFKMRA